MARVLQEGFDLACVSVMDANGDLGQALTDKNFGGENNDDWPLCQVADRDPLRLRGWTIQTGLPTTPNQAGTYATNSGLNYTRAETFLQLDNYLFHGSGEGAGSPLPINYQNDLTSNGLNTKFETTGDIQSAIKFLYDAPVWLEKNLETSWGADVHLGKATQGAGETEWNCLFVNFCIRVSDMSGAATGGTSIGLGTDFGFLVIPHGGGEITFVRSGVSIGTGVSIQQEGFGVFHQFTIKYLVDKDTGIMKIQIYVNGILRSDVDPFDANGIWSGPGFLHAEKLAIAKVGNCTVHLDDFIIDAEVINDLAAEQDSNTMYSVKDKFIISFPSRPKKNIDSYEQNKVWVDHHDCSILKPISDAFAASSDYEIGTFEVKNKTAVMIVKGNGSLNEVRQAHEDWDQSDPQQHPQSPLPIDQVGALQADGASNAWATAPVIDISAGYNSFVRLQAGVNANGIINKATDLHDNGLTNTNEQNQEKSLTISYALMGQGTHNINYSEIRQVTPPNETPAGGEDADINDIANQNGVPLISW